ncbi:uncharacterized protein LOC129233543 [Uloborus diversus]|uniref:uncharacterized protein LOC129233543 n=1 Tax=Uloborus diversus TaxID=327109 RepID=UPI0024092A86|nr:uncharacterized protein LOC129233543 [Uloborus diversus]
MYARYDETKSVLLSSTDSFGNTLLHVAVKCDNEKLVQFICHEKRELINISNHEGYLPVDYCQSVECLNILKMHDQDEKILPLQNKVYFGNLNSNDDGWDSNYVFSYKMFPELFENLSLSDTQFKPFICVNLKLLLNYLHYFDPDYVKLISKYARDSLKFTLWHWWVTCFKQKFNISSYVLLAKLFDPITINERNIRGSTPFHLVVYYDKAHEIEKVLEENGCDILRMNKTGAYVRRKKLEYVLDGKFNRNAIHYEEPLPLQYIILFELYRKEQYHVLKHMLKELEGSQLEKFIKYVLPT